MAGLDGDESHGAIRKKTPSLTKQIHEEILSAFDWTASQQ